MANTINKYTKGILKDLRKDADNLISKKLPEAVKDYEQTRNLSMIPKYLELAATKGGADRFNRAEIESITNIFKNYKTENSTIDILKELLEIGKTNGKPLTSENIEKFLDATTGLKADAQRNVLQFLKTAAEDIKTLPGTTLDEKIAQKQDLKILDYIDIKHPELIKAIGACKDPQSYAKIIKITEASPASIHAADAFIDVYKLSENPNLIIDLSKAFYPAEVRQIAELLVKNTTPATKLKLDKYTRQTYEAYEISTGTASLNVQRRGILNALGLLGKVDLIQIAPRERGVLGNPHAKISYGFERGKKR